MGFDITTSLRSGELDAPHIVYLNITCTVGKYGVLKMRSQLKFLKCERTLPHAMDSAERI